MSLEGPEEEQLTLREFFIELLKDGNLYAYHEDRNTYIADQAQGGQLTAESRAAIAAADAFMRADTR